MFGYQLHLGYNEHLKSRIKHHESTVNFYNVTQAHAHTEIYIYIYIWNNDKMSRTIFNLTFEIMIFFLLLTFESG